jgi:hypothetical protein
VKDVCFGYGIWAGLRWICIFSQGFDLSLDLVSKECFFVAFWVFPSLLSFSLLSAGCLGRGGFQGLRLFSLLSRPF